MESEKREIRQEFFSGERPLFQGKDLFIKDTIFGEGESPLKHSENIELENSSFQWKYPLWYSKNIVVKNCSFLEMARAGIWYTDDIIVEDTMIEAPKEFRRCRGVTIKNVSIPNAEETLWNCDDVELLHVVAKGSYFGMNCTDVTIRDLTLYGDYCFDGARNVEVFHSKFLSKDCFWNAENITIHDSYISGEYLAWNSKNVTLINCVVESLQGMCYIDNLVMKNCKLINTTLAFEYSTVEAETEGKIDSVMNPSGGTICADEIGELILQKDQVDVTKTIIKCESIGAKKECGSSQKICQHPMANQGGDCHAV